MKIQMIVNPTEGRERHALAPRVGIFDKKSGYYISNICIKNNTKSFSEKIAYYENILANNRIFGSLKFHKKNSDINRKYKTYFLCENCSFGVDGSWAMILDNALYGSGCPCCKSISEVQDKFKKSKLSLDNHLEVSFTRLSGFNVNDIRYTVVNKNGIKSKSHLRNYIIKCCRMDLIPQAKSLSLIKKIKEIENNFLDVFSSGGEIKSVAKGKKTGVAPFFAFNTGGRALMAPESSDCMSARGVNALIKKEKDSVETKQMLIDEASKSGALIKKFEYTASSKVITYLSRTGFIKEHTIYRARETLWGQSGYKQGEIMTGLILQSLFPESEWYLNKRYDFLSYNSGKLELDGYCEELGIAFEHQGRQHYDSNNAFDSSEESFDERVVRDEFKVAQCEKIGIKLLIIDQQKICVPTYFKYIASKLADIDIILSTDFDIEGVERKWVLYSENVLREFQRVLIEKLGHHKIICADASKIKKTDSIDYECGVCGETNRAQAKGFIHGPVRKYCPKCRGSNAAIARREKSIVKYKSEIPDSIFRMLSFSVGSRIKIKCHSGHIEDVTSIKNLKKKIKNGSFECTGCQAIDLGYSDDSSNSRLSSAIIIKNKSVFLELIKKAGLSLIGELYMRQAASKPEISAKLICSERHEFELPMKKLRSLLVNKFISNDFVPTVCPECCYPGHKNATKKATVFHRINLLKVFHKNVRYMSGFDPKGIKFEYYNCGELFPASNKPHPNFRIVYKYYSSAEKQAVKRMPCYICAVGNGVSISPGSKSLEMIDARMKLISESIKVVTEGPDYIATATYNGQGSCPDSISTTKDILDFDCGNPHHNKVSRSCDNYFSYHKIGFCKKCVSATNFHNVEDILKEARLKRLQALGGKVLF